MNKGDVLAVCLPYMPKIAVAVYAVTLQQFVAGRVLPCKKGREIEFVDSLPVSPAAKLLRRLLNKR